MAGILPQEEPCNKTCDEHETPGIPIGIPGVSYLAHSCMVFGSSRASLVTAAIITADYCTNHMEMGRVSYLEC